MDAQVRYTSDARGKVGGSLEQCGTRAADYPAAPGAFRLTAALSALSAVVVALTFCQSALAQSTGPAELTALQKTFAFDDQLKKAKHEEQAAIDALQAPYAKRTAARI